MDDCDGVVEFRNGDASCVHYLGDGKWEVCLTVCGEMGHHSYDFFEDAAKEMREVYGFDDAMVEELRRKTVEWEGRSDG